MIRLSTFTDWFTCYLMCLVFVAVPTQGNTVKSLRVRHGRVLMVATAQTWSPVTAALARQLMRASRAPLRTAAPMTRASTVVLVTALDCATVHLGTQVVTALQLLNYFHVTTFIKFTRDRAVVIKPT